VIPLRKMNAVIHISGEDIVKRVAIDAVLTTRMQAGNLSDARRKKTWDRIQGRRWGKVMAEEIRGVVKSIQDEMRQMRTNGQASLETTHGDHVG